MHLEGQPGNPSNPFLNAWKFIKKIKLGFTFYNRLQFWSLLCCIFVLHHFVLHHVHLHVGHHVHLHVDHHVHLNVGHHIHLHVFFTGADQRPQRLRHRWERLPKHIELSGGLRKWFPVQPVVISSRTEQQTRRF